MGKKSEHITPSIIGLSFCLFLAGWSLRVFLLDTKSFSEFGGWAIGFLVHIIWWPCFALFFIRKYSSSLKISLKEMICSRPKFKILIPALFVTIIYNIISWMVDRGSFGTSMPAYDLIITVLTVGFFEEIVFRGWFLNAISVYTSERTANIISAVLFSLIHFPGWIKKGYGIGPMVITGLSMIIIGLFFGFIFRRSRSIWTSAIVHSVWDMLAWIL